jgi:hypothetical protein
MVTFTITNETEPGDPQVVAPATLITPAQALKLAAELRLAAKRVRGQRLTRVICRLCLSMPDNPDWHLQETYKSLITISVEALKLLALANGGAAVAILTYLGSSSAAHWAGDTGFPKVGWALVCYGVGLFLSQCGFLLNYLTYLKLYDEVIYSWPGQRHRWFLYSGMGVAGLSGIAFLIGCIFAANALWH